MSELYPPGSSRMDVVGHLEELRRRIFFCLGFFFVAVAAFFSSGQAIMRWLQVPAAGVITDFVFLSPTEAFMAYVKAVLLVAVIVSFPVVLFECWAFLAPAITAAARRRVFLWIIFALVCFFGGSAFAYSIVLPAAVTFLVDFAAGIARPVISISAYISFSAVLILLGGVVFEIPVIMGLLTEAGILNASLLRRARGYAALGMVTLAAVITPTQDMFNLLILAVPMMVLYEIGILFAVLVGRRKRRDV